MSESRKSRRRSTRSGENTAATANIGSMSPKARSMAACMELAKGVYGDIHDRGAQTKAADAFCVSRQLLNCYLKKYGVRLGMVAVAEQAAYPGQYL